MQINAELTDTFGGEANYSWVRRSVLPYIEGEKQSATMRRVKRDFCLSGVRGRTVSYGDTIEFRPWGMCQVLFVTFRGD
jgi:hypothetical protein